MADDSAGFGSLNALATVLGVDWKTARKHVDSGLFKPQARGPNAGKYDIARCRELYETSRDPDAVLKGALGAAASGSTGGADPLVGNPLLRARTAGAALDAQAKQISLARLKGELIARADVEVAIRTAQTVVIERLEGLPGLLAARVQQAQSVAAGEAIIRDAVATIRDELANLGKGLADAA